MTVLAANTWRTNAELIADVAKLYLSRDDVIFDATYGEGVWWKVWKPHLLIKNKNNHDFRHMPSFGDGCFDVVAFDPPYVCVGGRRTTGIPEMHERYGLTDAPTSPRTLQWLIDDGLTECARVLKPKGYLLCKVQDYISSGKLWPGTHHTLTHALSIGLTLVDRFEHIGNPRPQPSRRRQVHARRNLSTLLVFRK